MHDDTPSINQGFAAGNPSRKEAEASGKKAVERKRKLRSAAGKMGQGLYMQGSVMATAAGHGLLAAAVRAVVPNITPSQQLRILTPLLLKEAEEGRKAFSKGWGEWKEAWKIEADN